MSIITTLSCAAAIALAVAPSRAATPPGTVAPGADAQATTPVMVASALSAYTPPACVAGAPFADITCTTPYDGWIEQFARDGITGGCGGGNYCPSTPVTRDQMAVFIERAMRGTGNWPPHTVSVQHRQAAEASSNANSGGELLAMVAAIPSSGAEAPSSTNPWVIRLGPGIFDLGSGSLILPPYTALEGAGQEISVITASGFNALSGTVVMGNRGRVSRLSVNNSGGSTYDVAVYLPPSASEVGLEHVNLSVSSPSNTVGGAYGLYANTNTSFTLIDSHVKVHGAYNNYGVAALSSSDESWLDGVMIEVYGSNSSGSSRGFYGDAASPVITNSRLYVSDGTSQIGIWASGGGGALDLRNSEVYTYGAGEAVNSSGVFATLVSDLLHSASGYGIMAGGSGLSAEISDCSISGLSGWLYSGSGFTVTVGASKLVGSTAGSGTVHCFGNYTGSGFLASTCP